MTDLDQKHLAEWIGDAFAILCVRSGASSEAETKLRLGFETLLRRLRITPLGVVAKVGPLPYRRIPATRADLRYILKALDSCLAVFERYDSTLTPAQADMKRLVEQARRYAEQELINRGEPPMQLSAAG